jgi:hypothetical protein
MSVWCPKCQTIKNHKTKCNMCGYEEEDNSKTWEIPKSKNTKIVKGIEKNKLLMQMNN